MESRELGRQKWRWALHRIEYESYRGMHASGAEARAQRMAEKLAPEMQADAIAGVLFSKKVAPGSRTIVAEPYGLTFSQPLPVGIELEYDLNSREARIRARGATAENNPLDRTLFYHECCGETFRDGSIPVLERALTYYLYWKLFPKRFAERFYP